MVKNNYLRWFLYSFCASICFGLAWIPYSIAPLIVISFFVFLLLEQEMRLANKSAWLFSFYIIITNFCLNFFTTYWIWNASPGGAVFAWIFDTMLMSFPFIVFFKVNQKTKNINYWFFIAVWISIELLHTRWEFSYPWLSLGNVFAAWPKLVQWYEITGVFGGSLWILLMAIAGLKIYNIYKNHPSAFRFKSVFNPLFIYVLAPIFLSFYILNERKINDNNREKEVEITVIQPNLDPYKKFTEISPIEQTKQMIELAKKQIKPSTNLVLMPETAIQEDIDERNVEQNKSVNLLDTFLKQQPATNLLTGASTFKFYFDKKEITPTARFYQENIYYDYYNTAVFKNNFSKWEVYHKSKLVPGVENLPYVNVFSFLKNFVINLGGTSGGLGKDSESRVFTDINKVSYAPVICYESVFGQYVTEYIKKGANIICIITNDAWWGNTAGYKQHFEYAKLRAIENRRFIARSANTGISGFIDDEGNVIQQTKWDEKIAVTQKLKVNNEITFYTKHGDYIASIAVFYLLFSALGLFNRRKGN